MVDSRYPCVSLGDCIRLRKEFLSIDDVEEYRLVTVQLHARGIKERSQLLGSQIKTKRQQRIRAGDLLVAEIDAKVGGFGIVPSELAGAIVSSHYFLYDVDGSRLDRRYLEYYLKSGYPEQGVQRFVKGSVNYAAIRPHHFPQLLIPLPPLEEQRRIVARLEALAGRSEEVKQQQERVQGYMQGLLLSAYERIIQDAPQLPMAEAAPLVRRRVQVEPAGTYLELGIRSFGKGTFHKPMVNGSDLGDKRVFRIEAGDLLFNIVFAWEGAVAVAKPQDHGRVGSHRFLTCVPKAGAVTAPFLCFHFQAGRGLQQLGEASPGAAGRNRTLGLKALEKIQVPVPPIERQIWFNALKSRADSVRELEAQAEVGLDALVVSVLDRAFRGESRLRQTS